MSRSPLSTLSMPKKDSRLTCAKTSKRSYSFTMFCSGMKCVVLSALMLCVVTRSLGVTGAKSFDVEIFPMEPIVGYPGMFYFPLEGFWDISNMRRFSASYTVCVYSRVPQSDRGRPALRLASTDLTTHTLLWKTDPYVAPYTTKFGALVYERLCYALSKCALLDIMHGSLVTPDWGLFNVSLVLDLHISSFEASVNSQSAKPEVWADVKNSHPLVHVASMAVTATEKLPRLPQYHRRALYYGRRNPEVSDAIPQDTATLGIFRPALDSSLYHSYYGRAGGCYNAHKVLYAVTNSRAPYTCGREGTLEAMAHKTIACLSFYIQIEKDFDSIIDMRYANFVPLNLHDVADEDEDLPPPRWRSIGDGSSYVLSYY